jgi:hypothetical protein
VADADVRSTCTRCGTTSSVHGREAPAPGTGVLVPPKPRESPTAAWVISAVFMVSAAGLAAVGFKVYADQGSVAGLVAGCVLGLLAAFFPILGAHFYRVGKRKNRVLCTDGLLATARIVEVSVLSSRGQHQGGLDLAVELAGRPPNAVKVFDSDIPTLMLAHLAPGFVLPVRVDPADATCVVIEWEAALAARRA